MSQNIQERRTFKDTEIDSDNYKDLRPLNHEVLIQSLRNRIK